MSILSTENEYICEVNIDNFKEFDLQYEESYSMCVFLVNEKDFEISVKDYTEETP